MKQYFLDANAHIGLNSKAQSAYLDFAKSSAAHGHPSSPALPGRLAAEALEIARGKIARLLGAQKPSQIIFTSSCTQAAEWGMNILAAIEPDSSHTIYSSKLEHPAVRDAVTLESEYGKEDYGFDNIVEFLDLDSNGTIKTNNENTQNGKVVCIHLQNEIGTIQPLDMIRCRYLFSDISQSIGKIPIDLSKSNIDIAIGGAHKWGGPGGVGFIYLKNPSHYRSFGTGSRYFLDRSGTPDVAGIVAAADALEDAIETLPMRTIRMKSFQTILEDGLEQRGFETIGKSAVRSPNTTFVNIPGKAFKVVLGLSERGVYTGLGSACGSMHTGPSLLVKALGKKGEAHDFMRISQFGEYDERDARYVLDAIDKIL